MNLLNLFDIVDAVAAQKQSEQPTDNVVDVPATVQASQANGQPATIVVPVAAASEVEVLEDEHEDSLNIGDEVIIAGNVQYQGKTGRVVDFGRNKHFVIVDLYNFGKHSFHSSNVEHNDYADSDEEESDWRERDHGLFGDDERDEVDENNKTIFTATKDLDQEQLPRGMGRGPDFNPQIDQWKNEIKSKYPRLGNIKFADIRVAIPKDGSSVKTAIVKHPKTGEYFKLGTISYNSFRPGEVKAKVYDKPQSLDPMRDRAPASISEASSNWEDESDQADRFHQMVVKKLSSITSASERNNVAAQLSKIEQKYFDAKPTFNDVFRVMLTPVVGGVLTALKTGRASTSQQADTPSVIAVGQRPQTSMSGKDKPAFDRTSREAKKFLANARDEILDADEGYELVKVVDALSRNQINNFRDVDWQEINTEFGPMVATADILVLVNKLGKNPSTDDVEVDNQEEVAEGAEFGAYYYEQLAQKVFDKYPDLSTKGSADELLDAGWKIAAQDLGVKRANWDFNYDEDFPSDFVSAYGHLQRGGELDEGWKQNLAALGTAAALGATGMAAMGGSAPTTGGPEIVNPNQVVQMIKAGKIANSGDLQAVLSKAKNKNQVWLMLQNAADMQGSSDADAVVQTIAGVREGVAEAKGLNKRVRVVKTGETGTIRQVKHGAFKGAPKSYFVDLDNGKQADNLPASALRLIKDGVAEGEYDPSYDPEYRGYQKPERNVDWDIEAERNAPEEPESAKTVTVTDNNGKVVLTFPSTGGFYGDLRFAASKGFDTDSGDYHLSWKRDTNEGNNWLDTPVSEEFDRIKKLAGLK